MGSTSTPAGEMVSQFLQALDTIRELIGARRVQREAVFREVVEPLFRQLEPVVDDYFGIFRETRDALLSGDPDRVDRLLADVRALRDKMATERMAVRETARVLQEQASDEGVVEFADALRRFFYWTSFARLDPVSSGYRSASTDLLHLLETRGTQYSDGQVLLEVNRAITNLEDAWESIARSYARLRLRFLAPWAISRAHASIAATLSTRPVPLPGEIS